MSSHRYQPVDTRADDDDDHSVAPGTSVAYPVPASPPPSFHSRASSPSSRPLFAQDPLHTEADQTLADTFGDEQNDSDVEDEIDDRQRLMRGNPTLPEENTQIPGSSRETQRPSRPRSSTVLPTFGTSGSSGAPRVIRSAANDGVFANLAAKPERGEKEDDLPPSYEQAAADATPPYWETTIVAPGMSSDEVYVDGLPVGSFFSFVWNGMISTSFQLVGFLLTYLLHTTHAAKNGSRAGLGLTLVQYGLYMKPGGGSEPVSSPGDPQYVPPNPNGHDFSPGSISDGDAFDSGDSSSGGISGITTSEWISYILMIVGWFILIRAISDYLRARRHEQLVLQSPERGLPVPIIAEGERPENAV
ncbi:metal homeostatis protein bsd2 [Coccidioides immitis RMSCC 3703]|uniref:Metal homeostatis protein bsd2 n=2 Tax=Coccidioides immitis TaxID=5501 RepID=A0A0J8RBX5_COCIT|nr:metal homeostatis protein bsd2 [Coccidioides immitis RMSCC 2394]KMU81930.1 metal homeostatis protein bsd2 [Coccidioides immitis RMSCC 3703]